MFLLPTMHEKHCRLYCFLPENGDSVRFFKFYHCILRNSQYLKQHHSGELIYVLGTRSLLRELKQNGIRVTTDCEDGEISCVLVSYDNQLTYEKISDTCQLLARRPDVDYIATNPDYVCPVEFGYVPDCGSICEMLEHAVKRTPYLSENRRQPWWNSL